MSVLMSESFIQPIYINEAIECHEWTTESLTLKNVNWFRNETPLCVVFGDTIVLLWL